MTTAERWNRMRLVILIFLAGFLYNVARGINLGDECWFLEVVNRVVSGEVLYRDVFFGTTPLSIYLAVPLATVFGPEIIVLKTLVAFCFAGMSFFAIGCLCRLNAPKAWFAPLIMTLLIAAPPHVLGAGVPYTPLAGMLFMACLFCTLILLDAIENSVLKTIKRMSITAGAIAGLCFSAKQNVGIVTLAALSLSIVVTAWQLAGARRIAMRALGIAGAACIAVILLMLLPVIVSGGAEKFFEYGFLNKGKYLQLGSVPYIDGFATGHWPLYGLPFLALCLSAAALYQCSKNERLRLIVVSCYAVAAFLCIFPRADYAHVTFMVPVMLLLVICSMQLLFGNTYLARTRFIQAIVCCVLMGLLLMPIKELAAQKRYISTAPHFRGALIETPIQQDTQALIRLFGSPHFAFERPFFVSPFAGFYYLILDHRNPVPFDYPLSTALGKNDGEEVLEAVAAGAITAVYVDTKILPLLGDKLYPIRLVERVKKTMIFAGVYEGTSYRFERYVQRP